jgi:hypothetical protein
MSAPQVVICRRASDPLMPGSRRGFSCVQCGLPLAATPVGAGYIERGAKPLCNACGSKLAKLLSERMSEDPTKSMEVVFTPEAREQMRRMGVDIEQWCRENGVPLEKRPCPDPDK